MFKWVVRQIGQIIMMSYATIDDGTCDKDGCMVQIGQITMMPISH